MDIVYKNAFFRIKTIKSTAPEKNADLIISEEGATNNKSIVEIRVEDKKIIIVVFWSHFSEEADICVHWAEDHKVLFVGAGSVSAVVDLDSIKIIEMNYPDLFWSWEFVEGNILELGELDCRLFKPSGELVGEAAVDPPYEYGIVDGAVEFKSIVAGKTRIEYKKG